MLNIDLLYEKPVSVYVSDEPITTNRISDIVAILSDDNNIRTLEGKPPWKYFALTTDWQVRIGLATSLSSSESDERIQLFVDDCKMEDVVRIYAQEVGLALVQQNENNGYQAAVGTATLAGVSISNDKRLIFRSNKFGMVYN